jgi:hypothetical protein
MSKFISGVVGAKFSPTALLAGGLMLTAAVNIAFGFGASLAWFCFFWALNGTLQVRTWPDLPNVWHVVSCEHKQAASPAAARPVHCKPCVCFHGSRLLLRSAYDSMKGC